MENSKNIWYITLLLSAVAGYCDTVTFVGADSIFSAHVTGNFIVFAYQIIKHTDPKAWVKLLTFPIFVTSVIIAGRVGSNMIARYRLLFIEGVVILLAGLLAVLFKWYITCSWGTYIIAMMVVVGMGLQNAFGKLYAKETFGPTTMMTGNVTQISLDLYHLIFTPGANNTDVWASLKKNGTTILGFLGGCVAGAVLAKFVGLYVLILPGLMLMLCYLLTRKQTQTVA